MKKLFSFILLCVTVAFGACDKDTVTPKTNATVAVTSVTLNQTTLELTPQQSKTLKATIAPDNASNKQVVWSSDNETIATITPEGVITGVAVGSTKIWAKSAEDNTIMDDCIVVVADPTVDISEVTLDADKLTIEMDQTKQLSVTITPEHATDRSVTWDSSDKTVATVSKTGGVTGLKIGKTTITVTSNADNGKSATCEVTVTEKAIPATDMYMQPAELDLKVDESKLLNATTIPTNATDQTIVWSSDDETIATVSTTGVVTGVKAGTTTVWVKWGPDHSIKDKCTVTVLTESSYAVGDLYPDVNNPIGIVFWKDPADPSKGKIVSLTEARTEWGDYTITTGALDQNNGMINMQTIQAISGWATSYPAFKWCSDIGSGWYLPAISEVKEIYNTREVINAAIAETTAEGAVELDTRKDYWTSTEKTKSMTVTIQFYNGFTGAAGSTSFSNKDGECNTRAVMKF